MNLPPNGAMEDEVAGRLDPRAKTIRVVLNIEVPYYKYDLYGKPFANADQRLMKGELTRLELRIAQKVALPGRNPDFFTEGVDNGWAFRLNGGRAPFFNANPACVWSEGNQKLIDQADYHWSKGDGTFEAWIKPEFDPSNSKVFTIAEAGEELRRDSPMALTYQPSKKVLTLSIRDFSGHSASIKANVELAVGKWSHIAACWSTGNGLALFLDGKKVASDANFSFQATNLETVERSDKVMPDNITLGCSRPTLRFVNIANGTFFEGAIDKVRVSTKARYTENFTPVTKLECDADTCAFFDFENTYDGVHGAGDGFIAGSVLALDSPYADALMVETSNGSNITSEQCRIYPEKIPSDNLPSQTLPVTNYPTMSVAKDFNSAREVRENSFTVQPEGKFSVMIAEPVYMDWLEIACPEGGKPLVGPAIINQGDIDVRSYGDLRDTLFPADEAPLSQHQRAIRLFSFLIHASDYFMTHQIKINAQNVMGGAEYGGLGQIAGYCGFECGPLNSLAMNTFVNVLGNPASMTFGNFHLFEQVFYDGSWRLYDLSAQSYFPSRRQDDAASLDEVEQDPYLLGRIKDHVGASHFYRLCARGTITGFMMLSEKLSYTLNPGESFRVHWQNKGIYNDLQQSDSKMLSRLQKGQGVDVTSETGVKTGKGKAVLQIDRPFPHYSNGFLRFDGMVAADNPAFSEVTADSFIYRVKLPYPIVAATYRADGTGLTYELSYDGGKTWRKVPTGSDGSCHLALEVRARNEYLLRVNGQRTGRFQAETTVQMNTRVLTGALHQGKNELVFKSDSSGSAKVTFHYRVDTGKELRLEGIPAWSAFSGEEKQLVLLNPDENCEFSVSGLSPKATLRSSGDIEFQREGNRIRLSTSNKKPRLASLGIWDSQVEKRIVVAVVPGSRWIPAEKMIILSGAELQEPDETRTMRVVKTTAMGAQLTYKFAPIQAGKYLIFHLGRNPLNPPKSVPSNALAGATFVQLLKNNKPDTVLVRKTNNSAEFYKAEKLLWRFRWDYPVVGNYPYEMMLPLELPAGDTLSVRCTCPEIELAGVLLLPADDMEFVKEFRKYCCGFNFQPQWFDPDLNMGKLGK